MSSDSPKLAGSKTWSELESAGCPLCMNSSDHVLFTAYDRIFGIMDSFTYVRCRQCSIIRLDPRPAPNAMNRYYAQTDDIVKRQIRTKAKKRPLLTFIEKHWRIMHVREVLKFALMKPDLKILDIGSGPGSFTGSLKLVAPDAFAVGIDNSLEACKAAHSIHRQVSVCGDAEILPFRKNSFDIITMFHYLEHSYNPLPTLKNCASLLKKEGILVVEVPNYDGLFIKILGSKWIGLLTPLHLYQFTPQSLENLLKSCGFDVISIRHKFFIPNLLPGIFIKKPSKPRNQKGIAALSLLFLVSAFFEWAAALYSKLIKRGYVMTFYARALKH